MPAETPTLRLLPGKERSILRFHPWVFTGAVTRKGNIPDGAVVQVITADGQPLGYGHYAQHSQIVCRMFAFGTQAQEIDDAFWQAKLADALRYRHQFISPDQTNAYRLINAEGDGMPGCTVDIYADTAVLQLRTPGAQTLQSLIVDFLTSELGIDHIYQKGETESGKLSGAFPSKWLKGRKADVEVLENELKFIVQPELGQKTGFFLDQRDNRLTAGLLAYERRVLNCFAYTGGFSVYALANGAESVTSVDVSESACALARRNVELNLGKDAPHKAEAADAFQFLREMEQDAYDLIVLDPPAFTKHISTVQQAARGYKDINMKAMEKIAPGGLLLTFSCSQQVTPDLFRKIVFGAATDAGRPVRLIKQLGHAIDHPVDLYHPEGEYLKGLLLEIG